MKMNNERQKNLGAAIRERRRALNMTQTSLADKAGINRSHLSLIETGEHRPTRKTVQEIARALDITPEALEWTGDYLAELSQVSERKIYPGLKELLNDPDAITLYKITEEEQRILRSIRLQWNNPSKQFFLQALLDYRNSRKKEE
jgi:transcriptional regulator with XRE-family HTH domain